jgi:preprotein translocase subunit SecY
MTRKKRKKLPALDKYVIFAFACIIIFTIICLVYQFIVKDELSPTLIASFYAVFGGELLLLCMIKRLKLKREGTDNEMGDG